ncbi:hypothetical protein BZA77DRAFT_365134 [Pyronema omphalodes]|nr:hypothetical protein BZA77DRAFT_365134 [Pyronema omphalodes]
MPPGNTKEQEKHQTPLLFNDTNPGTKAITSNIKPISVKEVKPLEAAEILSSLDAMVDYKYKQGGSDMNASPSLPVAPTTNVSVTSLQGSSDTAAVRTLLQRIEYNLVTTLLPLLAYCPSQQGSLLETPHLPPSFAAVETAITFCLNNHFSEVPSPTPSSRYQVAGTCYKSHEGVSGYLGWVHAIAEKLAVCAVFS